MLIIGYYQALTTVLQRELLQISRGIVAKYWLAGTGSLNTNRANFSKLYTGLARILVGI